MAKYLYGLIIILVVLFAIAMYCRAETTYLSTPDPNIIKKVTTTTTEINLEELQAEIDLLNEQIETMPDEMLMPSGKEELIRLRDEKVDYLNSITAPAVISK